MTPFEETYQRLNTQQKLAVDTIEGPVLVLAGPGTGKTQILSARIAAILQKTDVQPQNILALTFTNAGAKNLQQRVVALLGTPGYAVKTATFHSFCAEVIEEHGEYFPVARVSRDPVSEVDKFGILEDILRENSFPNLKNPKNPNLYLRDMLGLISDYKREGHTPLTIQKLAQEELEALEEEKIAPGKKRTLQKQIEKNRELAQVYAEYQRHLRDRHLFDFDDIILWVRDALREHEDLRLEYQEKYHYFLIDEFQDTNESQLQVVRELASYWGEQANIFVVGDPNQSIYRFQGASLANTFSFLVHYPTAVVISLEIGYRCGDTISQAAAEVISHNDLTITDKRLQSLHEPLRNFEHEPGKLLVHHASSPLAETVWVAREIQRLHEQGVAYADIAVLYHKHSHAFLLEEVLQREGVPAQKTLANNLLDTHLIQQILSLLRFLVQVKTKQELGQIVSLLQLPWLQLEAADTLLLLREGSSSKQHLRNPWIFWQDDVALAAHSWKDLPKLVRVREILVALQQQETQYAFPLYLEKVLRETGFYRFYTQKRPLDVEDLAAVASFLRLVQTWHRRDTQRGMSQFLQEIDRMQSHNLTLSQEMLSLQEDVVELSTAHNAKGKEWEYVFLIHAHDTVWGNVKSPNKLTPLAGTIPYADLSKTERNEDERRLFYVALTRAKKQVAISLSERDTEQDRVKELQPTQFLSEIQQPFTPATAVSADELQSTLRSWLNERSYDHPALHLERSWLKHLVDNFSLSFSALQELENCPTAFLYKRLLRFPELPQPALALGTAVHAGMEFLYRELNQNQKPPAREALLARVEEVLGRFSFPEDQLLALQAQAKSIVAEYYTEFAEELKPSLLVERYFGSSPPIVFEGLPLLGKVDRFDLIDSAANWVRVVDYKTGTDRSRNHILGKTASSEGMMFQQLVFYKLLAELDPSFSYTVTEGEFLFLEKTKGGKYRSERFEITTGDVEALKEKLREVKIKLHTLSFLEAKPCGHCEVCKLLGFQESHLEKYKVLLTEHTPAL